jgi:16S rRNA processing protein RimM
VSPESNDFITLARVVKTQGRRGEVAVEVHSDVPDRFAPGMKLLALIQSESRREIEVEDFWPQKGLLVLKFVGVDSISDAEKLVGAELQVPRSQRARLEPGWNYISDLVGCRLLDHGSEVGRIADVQFGAGEAPLLIVTPTALRQSPRHINFEIPFAEAYLEKMDLERREVRMKLPEGMLEINAPMTKEEKRQQIVDLKVRGLKPRRKRYFKDRRLRP